MLAIRMQRTGRKGHAQFRIVVQDARRTPTSGSIVTQLGHYNPHAKEVVIDKEKASLYLSNGAQPSESVARLLKKEGVKLPAWVSFAPDKSRPIRNMDKLRKNRPAEPKEPAKQPEAAAEEPATEPAPAEPVAEVTDETASVPRPEEAAAESAELVAEPAETTPAPADDPAPTDN